MKVLRPTKYCVRLLLRLFVWLCLIQGWSEKVSASTRCRFGDIVFTELMVDPEPFVGLPEVEYVELFNRSGQSISLLGWKFTHGDKSCVLPDYSLKPGAFVVLYPERGTVSMGESVLCVPSFPALLNTGRLTAMTDPAGQCVACLEYSAAWYGSTFKADGGWSLECIDPDNLSGKAANWTASVDPSGGTPGRKNSVNRYLTEVEVPFCRRLYVPDAATLELEFDRFMDPEQLSAPFNYQLEPQETLVLNAFPDYPDVRKVRLTLTDSLRSGVDYYLKLSGLQDANGIVLPDTTLVFGLPEKPVAGSLLINELLFNPLPGGCDYVELFVADNRWMDLSDLVLTNRSSTGSVNKGVRLSSKPLPAKPGSYWLLSESRDTVCRYGAFPVMPHSIDLNGFPSLPDDAGNLCLTTVQALQIDAMEYTESMHFALIEKREGVALEKRSPRLESSGKVYWTSAASTSHFGSPGFRNSQYFGQEDLPAKETGMLELPQKWLTPDNNGADDAITIYCHLKQSAVMTIRIYDLSGRLVKTLADEALAGESSIFTWDGTTEAGGVAPVGRYLLCAQAFSLEGSVMHDKIVITVLF